MPEIGFDEEPIVPVRRELTVTNKKPNAMIKSAPKRFILSEGVSQMIATSRAQPIKTTFIGRSRSVRFAAVERVPADLIEPKLCLIESMITGKLCTKLMGF